MSRFLLDTSVLIGSREPGELEGAISAASLAELHFGVLVAGDADERGRRANWAFPAACRTFDRPLDKRRSGGYRVALFE